MASKKEFDRMFDIRMNSSAWDMMIAKKVISRKRKRVFLFSGAAALATAASVLLAVNIMIVDRPADPLITSFMGAQLDGSMKDANLSVADTEFFEFEE